MIYTDLTRKAMQVAFMAHCNQLDKAGSPYIYHITAVADKMTDEFTTCVALLHDVLEDTDILSDDLKELNIPDDVIACVVRLTRRHGETYFDYIERLFEDPNACVVKIADLRHNSDLTRLPEITEKDRQRVKKYERALSALIAKLNEW